MYLNVYIVFDSSASSLSSCTSPHSWIILRACAFWCGKTYIFKHVEHIRIYVERAAVIYLPSNPIHLSVVILCARFPWRSATVFAMNGPRECLLIMCRAHDAHIYNERNAYMLLWCGISLMGGIFCMRAEFCVAGRPEKLCVHTHSDTAIYIYITGIKFAQVLYIYHIILTHRLNMVNVNHKVWNAHLTHTLTFHIV